MIRDLQERKALWDDFEKWKTMNENEKKCGLRHVLQEEDYT